MISIVNNPFYRSGKILLLKYRQRSKLAQAATFVAYILEAPGLYLGRNIDYPG
jgi:hypothetical protein